LTRSAPKANGVLAFYPGKECKDLWPFKITRGHGNCRRLLGENILFMGQPGRSILLIHSSPTDTIIQLWSGNNCDGSSVKSWPFKDNTCYTNNGFPVYSNSGSNGYYSMEYTFTKKIHHGVGPNSCNEINLSEDDEIKKLRGYWSSPHIAVVYFKTNSGLESYIVGDRFRGLINLGKEIVQIKLCNEGSNYFSVNRRILHGQKLSIKIFSFLLGNQFF
jgi:hypothetical protein